MRYMEDLIKAFVNKIHTIRISDWEKNFMFDMEEKTFNASKFSSKQAEFITKTIGKHKDKLDFKSKKETIDNVLYYQKFKNGVYESYYLPSEVRYLGENKLGFRSKYNRDLVRDIKSDFQYFYDRNNKIFQVIVTSENVEIAMDLIKNYNFDINEQVYEFLDHVSNNARNHTDYKDGKINLEVNNTNMVRLYEDLKEIGKLDESI